MSCDVGCRQGSDPALLWLWRRPALQLQLDPQPGNLHMRRSGPTNGKKTKKKTNKPKTQSSNRNMMHLCLKYLSRKHKGEQLTKIIRCCGIDILLSIGGDFTPKGHLAKSGDIFAVVTTRMRGCYWHLEGRGQGCCWTSRNVQDSTTAINCLAQRASGTQVKAPWVRLIPGQLGKCQVEIRCRVMGFLSCGLFP